jgi:hypothetical protein
MPRSATEVMQDIVTAAVIDGIQAMKAASKGLPNNLLRDLNAIHANTAPADLPAELQAAIQASVRAAFTRLLKEGYSVSPGQPAPARIERPIRREGERPAARAALPARAIGRPGHAGRGRRATGRGGATVRRAGDAVRAAAAAGRQTARLSDRLPPHAPLRLPQRRLCALWL